eukprot:CAMPEP_0201561804 /NCGR_PEP_ID=MMETSP0173_2-20130828/78989_1 /ASSEMBLY_ACC=CAM_ASM_000268 /TAXON_ID=218659 /ORGANISM="Vexillifera sp., Strain DIVA3 564/2" /LENGTH=460 /DNA_ID=CAMNT_0047976325 /DNA_START=620 /DNA_END=2003 /DNA_ORIENTATION=-
MGSVVSYLSGWNEPEYIPPPSAQQESGPYFDQMPTVSIRDGQIMIKVVLLGDLAVGKSSYHRRFNHQDFYHPPTICGEFCQQNFGQYRIQLWDTAGQERFNSIYRAYYRHAHAFLLCYDVSNFKTLDSIETWYDNCQQFGYPRPAVVLVGCKNDLTVDPLALKKAEALARQFGCKHITCSAKTNTNIDIVMKKMLEMITIRKTRYLCEDDAKPSVNKPGYKECAICYVDRADSFFTSFTRECCQQSGNPKISVCDQCYLHSVRMYLKTGQSIVQTNNGGASSSSSSQWDILKPFCSNSNNNYKHSMSMACPLCKQFMSLKDEMRLPKELRDCHEQRLIDIALSTIPNIRRCPIAQCQFAFEVLPPHKYKSCESVECPACSQPFCFLCNEIWTDAHSSRTCVQYAKWLANNSHLSREEKLSRQYKLKSTKSCPGCGFPTTRILVVIIFNVQDVKHLIVGNV